MDKVAEWERRRWELGLVDGVVRTGQRPMAPPPPDPYYAKRWELGLVDGVVRTGQRPMSPPPPDPYFAKRWELGLVDGVVRTGQRPMGPPPPDPYYAKRWELGLIDGVVRTGFSAKPSFSIVDNDGINPAEPIRMDATTPDALRQMLAQPWGQQAASHAKALGINPAALAATALIESHFRNTAPNATGQTYIGVFQMSKDAYIEGMKQVENASPALYAHLMQRDSIAGRMNPDVESAAAAGYMLFLAHGLQRHGIRNPTLLDLRAVYNFGPGEGLRLARARNDELMNQIVTSEAAQRGNNISPYETVGEWRHKIAAETGTALADVDVLQDNHP